MAKYEELRRAVDRVAAVDANAHRLAAVESDISFLGCFSEATEAQSLALAPHTLSFKRNVRDIAKLYNCEETYDAVDTYRKSSGITSITAKCFEAANISTVFIDDGIKADKMQDWEWHSQFGPAVGRILTIEHFAETILNDEKYSESNWTLELFSQIFVEQLKSVANKVVAMKSMIAYRSGLLIDTNVSKNIAEEGLLHDLRDGKPVRIKSKGFIDFIFICSVVVAKSFNLPMQIPIGLGDKDFDMGKCSPLHLRSFLEDKEFSKIRIVLLRAAHPYVKEAAYLASIFPQVYLDFGLDVPMLSVQGMISSVSELLHIAPTKKVMYSSDGFAFPEKYYLGSKRAREVLFHVLSNACDDGDLSIGDALQAVDDIFKQNALRLYKLSAVVGSTNYKCSIIQKSSLKNEMPSKDIVFVRIVFVDSSGQRRCRVVPAKRFYEVVANIGVGVNFVIMGMPSYVDGIIDGTNLSPDGEVRLIPDFSTKYRIPWSEKEEMVLADMEIEPGVTWEYCPRGTLRRITKILKDEFDLVMNAGFENEFFLLKIITSQGKNQFLPFDLASYCSTSGFDAVSPIFHEVNAALQALDISVEQIHGEAGKGQFEVALGHSCCTSAADNLVFTRETIKSIARKHGLLATFLPKYFLDDLGSGCHVHISLWKDGKNVFMGSEHSKTPNGMTELGEKFLAGVFHHLPSILAFIAPLPNSYDRLQPNMWSGAYHCWGRENKEAPLRTACPPGISHDFVSNFEIKPFDGCADPYLGLASIIAAGIDGLRRNLTLPKPVDTIPSSHVPEIKRLPKELLESVQALAEDDVLKDLLGEKLVTSIIAVRKAEVDFYGKNKEAYKQLIHKY